MKEHYVHVTFDIVEKFTPRVPDSRIKVPGHEEDAVTPRICVSDSIHHALDAIPAGGKILKKMREYGLPLLIHAYYLTPARVEDVYAPTERQVPDVLDTYEKWFLVPPAGVFRMDFEITDELIVNMRDGIGQVQPRLACYALKRVPHGNNAARLCGKLGLSEDSEAYGLIRRVTFGKFMANVEMLEEKMKNRRENGKQLSGWMHNG